MNPFFLLLARIVSGEPLRRPIPTQERRWAAMFALIPICIAPVALLHKYLDNLFVSASVFTVIAPAAVFVIGIYFLTEVWGRYVPAKASWVLGSAAWPLVYFLALTGRLLG